MLNTLVLGDSLKLLPNLPDASCPLIATDPPYGISYQYDTYDDDTTYDEYMGFARKWLKEVPRLLTANGSFWLLMGDSYAAELDVMCRRELGLTRRGWIVWHQSFGVNCKQKFTPSKIHLLYYVKNPEDFVFNGEAVSVPSARQLKYKDKRANPGGRLPNDVWVLDSKVASEDGTAFPASSDCWYASRVCGTFKERAGVPNQIPLPIMERIVSVSSNPGDLVGDFFAGSGTTLLAAKRLGRNYFGIELSENYHTIAAKRLGESDGDKCSFARQGDSDCGHDSGESKSA